MSDGYLFDAFVSYAHEDRGAVSGLVGHLRGAGLKVWIDEEQVQVGDSIVGRVQEGLAQSRHVLVCLSPAYAESRWCVAELHPVLIDQIRTRRTTILPLRLDGCLDDHVPVLLRDIAWQPLTGPGLAAIAARLQRRPAPASRPVRSSRFDEEAVLTLRREGAGLQGVWGTSGAFFDVPVTYGADDAALHRWYLEEYLRYPGPGDHVRAREAEARLSKLGAELFAALGAGRPVHPLAKLAGGKGRRALTVVSDDAAALALPWELLRDERGPLAFRGIVIRRQVPGEDAGDSRTVGLPLRVLLVIARPTDVGFIAPRSSAAPMLDVLEALGGDVRIALCDPPTLAELSDRLRQARNAGEPVHLVHFDGHGVYLKKTGVGALCFEGADGKRDLVEGPRLGDLLSRMDIPVALLEACQTADLSEMPVFGSVAPALLRSGVGSVLAFSHSVTVTAARLLVGRFYKEVCEGAPVGEALAEARVELHADPKRRINDRGDTIELRDWHIAQLYQRGEDPVLVPGGAARAGGPVITQGRAPDAAFGRPPLYGFAGRERELLGLRRKLREFPAVALTGMGGMGKTTLAREAAGWWARTGLRKDGAAFFSFEQRHGVGRAVQAFGRYLEGDAFERLGEDEQRRRAVELFHEREVLWVWDNFESTLPEFQRGRDMGTAFSAEERARLVTLYRDLVQGDRRPKGWLVVTCRPGETGLEGVGRMDLGGLGVAEALPLATTILKRHDVDLEREGYGRGPLEELLGALDGHPLSLELVLPHLREATPVVVTRELRERLARFTRPDAEEERNRGLLASLEFSLSRLGEQARTVIPWLAWFDGGAFEDNIIKLTQMTPEAWEAARQELLATALVREGGGVLLAKRGFLWFHPTLALAASPEDVPDPEAARERFVAVYQAVAGAVRQALDGGNPAGGMQVAAREEGNLRRAVEVAFGRGDFDRGYFVADTVGVYLERTGRVREQAEWAGWVQRSMAAAPGGGEAALGAERQHAWGLFLAGRAQEAVDVLERQLARLQASIEADVEQQRAFCLFYLGRVLLHAGAAGRAIGPLTEAIDAFERLGDRTNLSAALSEHANALMTLGRLAEALADAERGLAMAGERGDGRSVAAGHGQCAAILRNQRRFAEAEVRYDKALTAARDAGDTGLEAAVLQHLGGLRYDRGDHAGAVALHRDAIGLFQRLDDAANEMRTCDLIGTAEKNLDHYASARAWYGRARELAERLGDERQQACVAQNLGVLARREALTHPEGSEERRRLLGEAVESVEASRALKRKHGDDLGAALSLSQLGVLHLDRAGLHLADAPARAEALAHAEDSLLQGLAIREPLDHPGVWKDYANLEKVATARNDPDQAAAWRAKKDAKRAELARLESGATPALPRELLEALTALAQAAHEVRQRRIAVPPDLAETLAQLTAAPPPFPSVAAFLTSVATNAPIPPVPPDLPPPLAALLQALAAAATA